jgi:fluoride exporter
MISKFEIAINSIIKISLLLFFMLKIILLIGAGGFLGSIARYLLSKSVQQLFLSSFPFGTFIVNSTGCFLIGIIFGLAEKGTWMIPEYRLFLTVGLCGGFTTFSTFAFEGFTLLRDGQFFYFVLYSALSVLAGLAFLYFGHLITKII